MDGRDKPGHDELRVAGTNPLIVGCLRTNPLHSKREHMRTRYLVSGLVAAAFLSTTAFAQTTTPSTNPPPAARAEAPKLMSPHWRSSKMIGLVVYNEQNER